MKQGKKVVVSGPSGVGKGSVNSELLKDPKLHLVYSISMTTRQPRNGERDGINYYFVPTKQFRKAIRNHEFIEHAKFIGNYYGTPRKAVEEQTRKGNNVLLEIEVDGATQVINHERNVLSIFLMPPSFAELQNRIQGRATEPHEVIKARLAKALVEIPQKNNYQYVVKNDTVENAVAKITDIFIREGISDYPVTDSAYFKVEKLAAQILKEKYGLFLEIIGDKAKKYVKTAKKKPTANELVDELTVKLANQVYLDVLANGNFKDLENKRKIGQVIEDLLLDMNFLKAKKKLKVKK